ncbi:predicted protein [Plenodomus lingam JN3]|uniref:Predicted protein n=1 Tax=Leptosphaeria maculans (strain JN3 / isolate v23.1.3 / race Av1-4-5-6-7-8) TaxID=985895 RepID=E4ZRX8_LEPMJ|nr:predicted protein [Plenodomus lingam JN3]CBX94158.1 predicted protein [Plenodomus lingam JN3]
MAHRTQDTNLHAHITTFNDFLSYPKNHCPSVGSVEHRHMGFKLRFDKEVWNASVSEPVSRDERANSCGHRSWYFTQHNTKARQQPRLQKPGRKSRNHKIQRQQPQHLKLHRQQIHPAKQCKAKLYTFHHGGPNRARKGHMKNDITLETPCLSVACATCWHWRAMEMVVLHGPRAREWCGITERNISLLKIIWIVREARTLPESKCGLRMCRDGGKEIIESDFSIFVALNENSELETSEVVQYVEREYLALSWDARLDQS